MPRLRDESYRPNPEHREVYDRLYREYVTLHDYFGRGANDVMKTLKSIRARAHASEAR
jgi:L-ribulokinase